VSKVPSQRRVRLRGRRISATHLPQCRCRTPRYSFATADDGAAAPGCFMGCARGPRSDAAKPRCCCCRNMICAWICWICAGPRWFSASPAAASTDDVVYGAASVVYDEEEGGRGGSSEKDVAVGAGGGSGSVV